MYIKTTEGLGQDQESWSAPQALDRIMVQQVPIGYLGNFNEHLGKDEEQSCEARFIVEDFRRSSDKITPGIEKDVKDIAKNIVGLLERKLRPLQVKKAVTLYLHFEGHVDKTDPKQFGKLDLDRASRVGYLLMNLMNDRWNSAQFGSLTIRPTSSAAGASRPRSSTPGGRNRRVEVCIRKIKIEPYFSP